MSRNGAGTYSLPEAAFVYDTVISETAVNSNFTDIASALTASLAANGETTVTANLPMNSKKFTGLAVGTVLTDSLTLGQAQNESYIWCGTMTGTADAGVLTPAPAITAYAAGQRFAWVASANVNTTAMTVAISGLSTIAAQNNGAALAAGDHAANKLYIGILDTTSTIQIQRVLSPSTFAATLLDDASAAAARTTLGLGDAATGTIGTDVLSPTGEGSDLTFAKGADIASAGTLVIGTDGSYFDITGTTAITGMTVAANRFFTLQFDGALTLTHGASLNLPGAANITTAAGDEFTFYSTAADTVRCIGYALASGEAIVGGGAYRTLLETVTPSASATAVLTAFNNTDYGLYEIELENVLPVTDGVLLYLRTSTDGGSSYDSGASDYGWALSGTLTPSSSDTNGSFVDTKIQLARRTVDNVSGGGVNGTLRIRNAGDSLFTNIIGNVYFVDASGGEYVFYVANGVRKALSDVDAVQLLFASGNIASGTIRLYGIKEA